MDKGKFLLIWNQTELSFILLLILLSLIITFFSSFEFFSFLPFPDSVYYVSGMINLLKGNGFIITANGQSVGSLPIPLLYPLYLLPFYAVSNNFLALYIANTVLAVCSLTVFMKICRALNFSELLFFLSVSLYISNFLIFWFPSLVMAENLLQLLFLSSVYLTLKQLTPKTAILSGLLITAMFFSKYVSWGIGFAFGVVTLIKILIGPIQSSTKYYSIVLLFTTSLLLFTLIILLESQIRPYNPLNIFVSHLYTLASTFTSTSLQTVSTQLNEPKIYSTDNFSRMINIYLSALLGVDVSIAGIYLKILPPIFSVVTLSWPFFILRNQKLRFISLYFLMSLLSTIIFLGFFYEVDGRYLFVFIPAMIITFCLVIQQLTSSIRNSFSRILFMLGVITAVYALFFNLFNTFNSFQIINNYQIIFLNYQAAKNLSSLDTHDDIYTVTTLSPFYLQLFIQNPHQKFLPLSKAQFYLESPEKTWSIPQSDYEDIYIRLLNQKKKVYFLSYATSYPFFYEYDRDKLEQKFQLSLIKSGCNNQCDIFELRQK